MFYTYILYSHKTEKYYTGSTENLKARLERHNRGVNKATKFGAPWDLVFYKEFNSRSEAVRFEYFIKKQKSRAYIEKLIYSRPDDNSMLYEVQESSRYQSG